MRMTQNVCGDSTKKIHVALAVSIGNYDPFSLYQGYGRFAIVILQGAIPTA
jgi:hypothetical protein